MVADVGPAHRISDPLHALRQQSHGRPHV
jgi:hypothetical protein